VGGRQIALHLPAEDIRLQRAERQGAEDLVRGCESCQKVIEEGTLINAAAHVLRKHALGGSRGTDEEHMLSGDQGQQGACDLILPFFELRVELISKRYQFVPHHLTPVRECVFKAFYEIENISL